MKKLTEEQIIKYVQKHARYYMHGFANTGSKYAVKWKRAFYHSNDTLELVEMIKKAEG